MFVLVCLLAVGLAGCHGKKTEEVRLAQVYETGQFRVSVPEKWKVLPIEDPFAEGRPIKSDCLFLRKGGKSDWHVSEKPYIRIDYFGPGSQMEKPLPDEAVERNVQQLQPFVLGELLWSGYTAESYHGRACIGRFVILWAENGDHKFCVCIWLESGGEKVALEDPDVQMILAGLAPSGGS